jgi:hypothetical protein
MQLIKRTKTLEGTVIPGVIHNGHYFYVNIEIYEDGMINCWELVDLNGLREKIRQGWLVTDLPKGADLSIHGLGQFTIESAFWNYREKSYYKHIKNVVKSLNPGLNNIYKISTRERETAQRRKVIHSPRAMDFYVKNEFGYQTVNGSHFNIFMRYQKKNYLVNLVVYKDDRVCCYTSDFVINSNLTEIERLFKEGTFFTTIHEPTTVIFGDFAEIVLSDNKHSDVDIIDKYKELLDLSMELKGEMTSLERCREAYHRFLESPTEIARANLKVAYDQVPMHERIYLGDMDAKNGDYQRIIYNPESKREV